jgi:hypothetical protein
VRERSDAMPTTDALTAPDAATVVSATTRGAHAEAAVQHRGRHESCWKTFRRAVDAAAYIVDRLDAKATPSLASTTRPA